VSGVRRVARVAAVQGIGIVLAKAILERLRAKQA
jgi:hypothetical protein